MSANTTSIDTGGSITFTASSDTATDYWIGIDKDNQRIITQNMPNGTLTLTFDNAGTYSAYVTSSNSAGGCDSAPITFIVSEPTFQVTLDANGGSCSPTSTLVRLGNAYGDLPNATRTGYTFVGWFDEWGNQITSSTVMTRASNHTLYAHWSNINYIVYFDGNGGSADWGEKTVTYDETYGDLPNASRIGYSFVGWFDEWGNQITSSTVMTRASNHTLYAYWNANQYTINLDANGGTVSPESIVVTYDGTYSNLPDPTQTGYHFNGWFTENGTQISNPDIVKTTSDLTLYAHWSRDKMMISFNANGGTSETANKLVTFDTKYGVLPNAIKTGYTFEGWYLDENFTTPITEGSIVKITANQLVYAKWNLKKFTIKFDANGGTAETSGKQVIFSRTYGVLPIAEKENDVFVGWFTEDGKEITPDTVVTISSNTVLYAKWQSEIKVDGDVNSDGVLDVNDVKLLQNYLHHKDTFTKETFESADLNNDGKVNVVDLAIMKRSILRKNGD